MDRTGDEVYQLRFRDLDSGVDLADEVPQASFGGAWSAASDIFFYTVKDEAHRPSQVWRHMLGTAFEEDVLVLEDPDEQFEVNVRASRSGGLVVLWSRSRDTNEVWVVDARRPSDPPRSVGGRRNGVEYHAEHAVLPDGTDTLLVVTNDEAEEFRLVRCPVPREADQDAGSWEAVRSEDPAERLERVDAFATHAVLWFRSDGRRRLRVLPMAALDSRGF